MAKPGWLTPGGMNQKNQILSDSRPLIMTLTIAPNNGTMQPTTFSVIAHFSPIHRPKSLFTNIWYELKAKTNASIASVVEETK